MNRTDLVVIDDEFPVLYTIRAILEDQYPDMQTFTDPEEGLSCIRKLGARVVITDLRMPQMSGLDLLANVNALDPDIQVIILTAHGSEKVAVEAMKQGAFHYITKPFDPEELTLVLKKGLEQFELRKSIQYDLELARTLQNNLLPQGQFRYNDFTLSARYIPGGQVGGDFYDYLPLPDASLGILIADASGHGVASAMMMAMLKIAFRNSAPAYTDPAKLLCYINDQFHPILKARSFFTAFYAILETNTMNFTFASAGHPFPLFFRPGVDRLIESSQTGLNIGLFPDAEYHPETLNLKKGDRVLFYTDGLSELGGDDNFFNNFRNRFREYSYENRPNLLDCLGSIVQESIATAEDDITLLLLES